MTRPGRPSRRTVAVIYAGDGGSRPGREWSDLLAPLAGRAVVEHSLAAFAAAPAVDEVLMIAGPALADRAYDPAPVIVKAVGSAADNSTTNSRAANSRARSIAAVLEVLAADGADDECDVLIHDADRPLIGPHVIADCLAALADSEAVCAAVPASDTMVAVENDVITGRPVRDRLRYRQYPQGFRLPVIRRGYQLALADPAFGQADDCAVVLRYLPGVPVRLVAGSEQGFRITSQADLSIAETLLQADPLR